MIVSVSEITLLQRAGVWARDIPFCGVDCQAASGAGSSGDEMLV